MPDPYLDADAIRAATFVRHVEIHDTLGSTNDRAAELAHRADIELPALIATRHQTAGRGRGTNTWSSSDGALTFSVLLEPSTIGVTAAHWPQLSLATAVAVCDAVGSVPGLHSHDCLAIKWPNDVFLRDAKICGILIESHGGAAPAKNRLIIGIGINVNNSFRTGPINHTDVAHLRATSLRDSTEHSHNLDSVLCCVLCAIEDRFTQVATHDPQLPSAWQSRCWLHGKSVEVCSESRPAIVGICRGIDREGALLIETATGIERTFSGSVRF